MKILLSIIGGFLLFFNPLAALAAQDILRLSSINLIPILLNMVLIVVVVFLGIRLQRANKAKQGVQPSLDLAQQALERSPTIILWTDANLSVVKANTTALQSAGETVLIGRQLLELYPQLAEHQFVVSLQTGSPTAGASRCKDASPQRSTLDILACDGQNNAIWCALPSCLFDENQEEKERKIREANEVSRALESANRMKSEFIANINHEIRTPMNAIIGYAEMLSGSDLGPREMRFVSIIHKSSMALIAIFNDIMELSKIDSGRTQIMLSPVRLQSIINDVEEMFQEAAKEKELRFRCTIAPHIPQILLLDGIRLKQILQNLISNAVRFTAQGHVVLEVDGNVSPEHFGCFDLRFTVEDSGTGISSADQQKICELFQQSKENVSQKYSGVGLGLTLCSRLITMMNGHIELSSKEGNGACFTVFLQGVKIAEGTPVDVPTDVVPSVLKQGQKLLIVDDVDLIKDVFIDYFQGTSLKILTANNGEEAMELAVKESPDVIFMDLNLAGMDGRSVTKQLRNNAETSAIPVVVMTGDVLGESDYRPLFDDFLQKPFRLEELKAMVARYVQPASSALQQPGSGISGGSDGGGDVADQQLLSGIIENWTTELEQLRLQAVRSGSLADAISLGAAMLKTGERDPQSPLTLLGGELVQYAAEPNILGVDRLLAKLSSVAKRK